VTKTVAAALVFATLATATYGSQQSRLTPPALPAPGGRFAVGRIDYHWIDISRAEPHSSEADAHRELMVHVWYPAEGSGAAVGQRAPYVTDFPAVQKSVNRETLEALVRPAPYSQIESTGLPETHAVEDAGMPKDPARFPVLVFSHGLGNPAALYTAALEDLASHGFVVAAIDHTYDNAFTIFPGSRVVRYAREAWSRETARPNGYVDYVKKRIEEMWAPDIRFVITQLQRYNGTRALQAPFTGRLDLRRLGAFGHSMGGLAAVRACQLDVRIQACVNEDADIAGSPFVQFSPTERLKTPLLFFTAATANVFKASFIHPSDADLVNMKKTRAQYDADVKRVQTNQNDALANVNAASYRVLIDRPSFVHRSFSDLTLLAAYYDSRMTTDAARDFEIAQSCLRAFFDKHLKGVPNSLMDQTSAPYPGVRIDRFDVR
jgi:predicted dienelactone hydrolase